MECSYGQAPVSAQLASSMEVNSTFDMIQIQWKCCCENSVLSFTEGLHNKGKIDLTKALSGVVDWWAL